MTRWQTHLFVGILLAILSLTGAIGALRAALSDWRFAQTTRVPSGNIVLVTIDAKALDRVGIWPWPRSVHADLLTRLQQQGVADVAFDVDFSARTNEDTDRKFSEALEAFGGSTILPIFKQITRDEGPVSRVYVSRPLPELSAHSWLATVNVVPERDGVLRAYPQGETIDGSDYPSLAALLVGHYDAAGTSFRVDFGIDMRRIPVVSVADILSGAADPAKLRGKKVIVGATAIELGDRFTVPVYGVLAGVELQALAAESVLQKRMLSWTGWPGVAVGLLLIVALGWLIERRLSPARASAVLVATIVVTEFIAVAVQSRFPTMVDTAPWVAALGAYLAAQWLKELDVRGMLASAAQEKFQSIARSLGDGVIVTDAEGRVIFWNPAAETIFQVPSGEAKGRRFSSFLDSERHRAHGMLLALSTGIGEVGEFIGQRKDGSRFPLEVRLSTWEAAGRHHSVIARDISSRKRSEERIRYLAMHDGLTGLTNRAHLCDALKARIACAGDHPCFAVFLIDLDDFKQVNDTLGHDGGDKLLCHFSRELVRAIGVQATTARLGGDEFAVVLEMIDDQRDQVAETIRNILGDGTRSTFVDGRGFHVSASVGSALFPADGVTADDLLRHADLALYRAKKSGRALHIPYHYAFKDSLERHRVLEADLVRAIEAGELELHYQPQVTLADGTLIGAEALMRWRHKERGLIMPGEFLPVLSNCAMSTAVGEWVLRTACRQAAAWHAAGKSLCIGVNLFPSQFLPELPQRIAMALDETGLPPHLLEIEITENILLCDDEKTTALLTEIRNLGVRVALDDFGTGFASLTHLKRFPLDRLKIDRSFVTRLASDRADTAIVKALIGLSRELGLSTIAEGIEDAGCVSLLCQLGCNEGQGFHFGHPMTSAQWDALVGVDGRFTIEVTGQTNLCAAA